MRHSHLGGRGAAASGLFAPLALLGTPAEASDRGESVVFRGVRVFDGSRAVPSMTVVVREGVLEQIGTHVESPPGAWVLDGTGKTLVPGFIDCHTHTLDELQLRQAAVFGVTTVLDMASDPRFAAATRAGQATGGAPDRADLLSAGAAAAAGEAPGLPSVRRASAGEAQ